MTAATLCQSTRACHLVHTRSWASLKHLNARFHMKGATMQPSELRKIGERTLFYSSRKDSNMLVVWEVESSRLRRLPAVKRPHILSGTPFTRAAAESQIHSVPHLLGHHLYGWNKLSMSRSNGNNANEPMHLTPMPSALLARRLRSRLGCQKQVGAGDRGR